MTKTRLEMFEWAAGDAVQDWLENGEKTEVGRERMLGYIRGAYSATVGFAPVAEAREIESRWQELERLVKAAV